MQNMQFRSETVAPVGTSSVADASKHIFGAVTLGATLVRFAAWNGSLPQI